MYTFIHAHIDIVFNCEVDNTSIVISYSEMEMFSFL